jgi:hypothetical protein
LLPLRADNSIMGIEMEKLGIASAETVVDLQAVIDAMLAGEVLDPEVERRVRERADKVRSELQSRAPTNVAVDLIRESRDEAFVVAHENRRL